MDTTQATVVNGNNLPILQFENNEAYGAMQGGFTLWWLNSLDPQPYSSAQESVIKNLKIWNVYNKAVYMYPSQKVTYDGLKIRGSFSSASQCCGNGVYFADYSSKGVVIKNSDIQGMEEGITAVEAGFGPEPQLTIQNTYLRNFANLLIPTNGSVNGCWMSNKLMVATNTQFAAPPGRSLSAISMVRDVAYAPECLGKLDELKVYAYNGNAADNFQVYHPDSTVLPRPPSSCTPTTRAGINGLLCPIAPAGPVAPTATFSASPASISAGQSATLSWTTTNASSVTIDQGIGTVAASGTRTVSPVSTTTFKVTATNSVGSVSANATVTVAATSSTLTISTVAAKNITTTAATITWTTNLAASSRVDYGTTTAYGKAVANPTMVTSHSVTLTGLSPSTTYHYRITSQASTGTPASTADRTVKTASPPDTTAPTVTGRMPANGATGVSRATTASATFSEPMTASTITTSTVILRDPSSTVVTASVSYHATTRIATLTPSALLRASTRYTVTVKGGSTGVKDLAGNALVSDSTWWFTTGATTLVTIWTASATPAGFATNDSSAAELGLKFRSDVAGHLTGVRFYKGSTTTGTHTATLWSSSGTKLATATFSGETVTGWQQVNFVTPVAIAANAVYVVSYHTNVGNYPYTSLYFASKGVDRPPLHALSNTAGAGNGIFRYGSTSAFPTSTFNSTNYWVDVVFRPQ
jgi:hypothetical protein